MTKPIRDAASFVGASLLKTYGQETASTTGTAVDFGPALYQGALFVAYVTANGTASGSNSLAVVVEGSNDGTTYETVATFTAFDQATTAGLKYADFDAGKGPKRYYRYASTETGTADVTYLVMAIGIEPSQAPITQV